MKAVVLHEYGGPEKLKCEEIADLWLGQLRSWCGCLQPA